MNKDRFKFRVWDEGMFEDSKPHYEYASVYTGLVLKMVTGHHPIEQCTGLKDKNGNLIYEGDIIKTKTGSVYEIKWVETGFFAYDDGFINAIDFLECPEIIGNVHEQKDNK